MSNHKIILTEKQLQYILRESNIKNNNKQQKLLNEVDWNFVADIVGIVDPTGVVDLANGISYATQGRWLFAFLSWVAIVPYVGDVVAKPFSFMLRGSKGAVKSVDAAIKTGKAGKVSEALGKAGVKDGAKAFVKGATKPMEGILSKLKKIPGIGLVAKDAGRWWKIFSKGAVMKSSLKTTKLGTVTGLGIRRGFAKAATKLTSGNKNIISASIALLTPSALRTLGFRTKMYGRLAGVGTGEKAGVAKEFLETPEGEKWWDGLSEDQQNHLTSKETVEESGEGKTNDELMKILSKLVAA
jgi:hypothetical protein